MAAVDVVFTGNNTNPWTRSTTWSALINPGRAIPVQAMAIHHITDEMVAGKPDARDVFEDFVAEPRPIACAFHNSRFDVGALKRSGCDVTLLPPIIDTYRCAIAAWQAPSFGNQALRYWLGLKLADVSLAQPHRAAGDAYVTAALVRRLLTVLTVDEMIAISSRPARLPHFQFGKHVGKPIAEVPIDYFEFILFKSTGEWDEDVLYTATQELHERKQAARSRSPV